MSIAVIIPLYNGEPWIGEAIDSVLLQEMRPSEIVVIDDGSTDRSPELVRAYPDVTLLHNPGKGSCVARNHGLTHTRSHLVAFLDQDDVWHPSHLRRMTAILQENAQANTVFATPGIFTDGEPEYAPDLEGIRAFDPWTRFPFTVGVDGPSLALIRRSSLEQVGMWEEASTGMGDVLLFLKLACLHPLLHATSATVGKRIHASQQWLQVRTWGAHYLARRHEVMRLALDFRTSTSPSDPKLPALKRRLAALLILRDMTADIEEQDARGIVPLARQLEEDLVQEAPEVLRHALYCLMGALYPTYDRELLLRQRDKGFSILLELWPRNAPRTREAIRSMIGEMPRVS